MFTVVRAADSKTKFDSWYANPAFSAVEAHPAYGGFGRVYYPAVFAANRADESFAVLEDNQPLLLVSCSAGAGELDYFGFPIRFFTSSDSECSVRAFEAAFDHIDKIAVAHRVNRVTIADGASLGTLSAIGKQCLNRHAHAALRLTGMIDLGVGESGMKRDIRKSFQSLINWGKRNLKTVVVGAENPDREMFARYQAFHHAVAGRVTRPQESWDAMFQWIAAGGGELILGFLADGALVTGTMIVDGSSISSYASGVYDRAKFDLPLGHWPLWQAIVRSAERGKKLFDLGDLPLDDAATPKEVAIGYFKRGFAANIATWVAWNWRPEAPERTQ